MPQVTIEPRKQFRIDELGINTKDIFQCTDQNTLDAWLSAINIKIRGVDNIVSEFQCNPTPAQMKMCAFLEVARIVREQILERMEELKISAARDQQMQQAQEPEQVPEPVPVPEPEPVPEPQARLKGKPYQVDYQRRFVEVCREQLPHNWYEGIHKEALARSQEDRKVKKSKGDKN